MSGTSPILLAAAPATRAAAVSGPTPELDPVSPMQVHAAFFADQQVHATDPDGHPLTFQKIDGPGFMTVDTNFPGTGSAYGNIHLYPHATDTGVRTTGTVGVGDGTYMLTASFSILVYPVLDPPADMVVDEGATADQLLTAFDPDHGTLSFFFINPPPFAGIVATSDTTAVIHLAPRYADAGSYQLALYVTDQVVASLNWIRVTVNDVPEPNEPPVLSQPEDMHATPLAETRQVLTASDPDLQPLTYFKVSGPAYMSVGAFGSPPRTGYVLLRPFPHDTGTVVVTVAATDGTLSDQKSFTIRVDTMNTPPDVSMSDMELAEGSDQEQTVVISDPDNQALYLSVQSRPPFMTVTGQQAFGSDSLFARFRLLPTYGDAGTYEPTIHVSDIASQVVRTLHITVQDAYPGESSLRLATTRAGNSLEYEYSAVDGSYSATGPPNGLTFQFKAAADSAPTWTIQLGGPEGPELHEGSVGTGVLVTGGDGIVPELSGCSDPAGEFEIKRLVRRLDGSLLSVRAVFRATCDLTTHGDLRYQVQSIPITLVAPRRLSVRANENFWFDVTAADTAHDAISVAVNGLPAGGNFIPVGPNQWRFGWIPNRGQTGEYRLRFIASSAGGAVDTALTTLRVLFENHAPVAMSNGPYEGTAGFPIQFSSVGTLDPDGDALSHHWNFGDGTVAAGPAPAHAYEFSGLYAVSLTVGDGNDVTVDPTLAYVSEAITSRVFVPGGTRPLRLEAGSGRFCVALEILSGLTSRADVDPASFRMLAKGLGSVEAISVDSTTLIVDDSDRNGTPDVTACFTREDLRRLFGKVSGRVRIAPTIEVALRDGHGYGGVLSFDVIGAEGTLPVLVAPNPINPAGTLSFVTSVQGPARLILFDSRGNVVRTLLHVRSLDPGYHDVPIDGQGEGGTKLSSGVYYYRLETGEGRRTGRIAIVR